jgi:glucosylceramidase
MPNNGPFDSDVTIITLDAETKRPIVNSDFYMYGQFMKFIDRGAIRIGSSDNQLLLSSLSSSSEQFAHVAFLNPSNDVVLIAVNPSNSPQTVTVHFNKKSFTALLPLNATATFKWKIEEMISDK